MHLRKSRASATKISVRKIITSTRDISIFHVRKTEARARLQPQGGRVAVSALSPQLERVFRITNLDRIFTFHPDLATGVEKLTGLTA